MDAFILNRYISNFQKSQIPLWIIWIIGIIHLEFGATSCQLSGLEPGVNIMGTCAAHERETCDARCVQKDEVIWQRKIQCLNGKWTPTPFCQGTSVVKSLEKVNCDTLPIKVKNKTICLKITEKFTLTKKCPDLIPLKLDVKNCSRDAHTDCKVSCGESYDTLKCLPNGKWSHVPKCKTLPLTVCSAPKAVKILNCSLKEGEKCKMQCPDGKIINEEVTCLESGDWSFVTTSKRSINKHRNHPQNILSKCTCPPPPLQGELISTEDCSGKKIKQTCHLSCKKHFAIIGHDKIVCQNDLSWSSFPECSDKTCPIPWLDDPLSFEEDCAAKLSGEICKLRCEGNSRLVEEEPFRCINGTHWTVLPRCLCHPPVLPDNVITDEDCKNKLVGAVCKLKCKGRFSVLQTNFITCQTNGTWTTTPTCQFEVCTRPDLPRTAVVTKDDCSFKRIGETCTLECLKVPETYEIRCLNTTRWSTYSKCSCPSYMPSKNMQFEEDCSEKKPGEKCKVSCKNRPLFNKLLFITCLTNSEWSSEPLCDELVCPPPILPSYLTFSEGCSKTENGNMCILNETESRQETFQNCQEKSVGSTCEISCKNGGKVIGPNIIVCLNTLKWSPFPSCACSEPQISEGLQLTRSCQNILPGSECKLKCDEHLELIGNSFIRCLENLSWSSLPTCSSGSCSYPQVPESISISETCANKIPGDTCKITCKYGGKLLGNDFVICLNKTHWSAVPFCTCPKPILNSNLKFVTKCEDVFPGQECKLVCENNFKMSGRQTITCGNNSQWSDQPVCKKSFCQTPSTVPPLVADDSCSSKEPGDVCSLSCKDGGIIIGNSVIKCLNTTTWSELPHCGCQEPSLNDDLVSTEDCKNKIIGHKCYLKCKKGEKLVGDPFIVCQINATWSSLPLCKLRLCSKPTLPEGILEPTEDCSSKSVGEKCILRCIEGGNIIGSDYIECLNESNWSKPPTCTCPDPKPHLPENLVLEKECINETSGMECRVTCNNSMKLIGKNSIKCNQKTKWNRPFPRCEILYCPQPNLTDTRLTPRKECKFKTANDTCELGCKKGRIIGPKFITCLNGTNWSTFPKCSCRPPVMKGDLIIAKGENCTLKESGMECKLSCKNGKKISDFITCQNDGEWSPLPKCQETFCPKPNIPSYLTTKKNCSSIEIDQTCELNCTGGRKVLGQNYITCLSNLTWSPAPKCTCPPLNVNNTLRGACGSIMPEANCSVTCKHPMATAEKNFITCNNESQWTKLDICKRVPCKNIGFSDSSSYIGKCENKIAGDTCRLNCKGGGVFLNNMDTITCTKNGDWTKPHKCVCHSITSLTSLGLALKEPCINKNPKDICRVQCINGLDLKDKSFFVCDETYRWSSPPSCEKDFCLAPGLPQGMMVIEGNCSRLKIQTSCKVQCLNGGLINGSDAPYTIFCSADAKLSKIPACTCRKPTLPQAISSQDSCEGKEVNDVCLVRCNVEPNIDRYISCLMQKEWMWSAFPDCPCTTPQNLKTYITLEERCIKNIIPVNTTCKVTCGNFGGLVAGDSVTCLPGSTWSESPSCTCAPPPIPPSHSSSRFVDVSACQRVMPGNSCPVTCLKGTINKNFLHCNESFFWQEYPSCEIKCSNPRDLLLQNFVALGKDCESKSDFSSGEICHLICLNGGEYVAPPAIQCTDNAIWNSTAFCTCPKPDIPDDFAFAEIEKNDCKDKFKTQACTFVCRKLGYKIKQDKRILECEGKLWKGELECEQVGTWCPNPAKELERRKIDLVNGCSKDTSLPSGKTCVVKCLNPGSVMMIPGQNISTEILQSEIQCSTSGTWLNIPHCSCYSFRPEPPLLLKENCDKKFHLQKCFLSIASGYRFVKEDYVECSDGSWGDMPSYTALEKCSKPPTNDNLLIIPNQCSNKSVNQACNLRCRNNAFFMNTTNTTFRITCTAKRPTGVMWSAFPLCACMNFNNINYRPRDSCAYKRPGETCQIFCNKERVWGFITCSRDGRWSRPVCASASAELSGAGSDFMGRKRRHSKNFSQSRILKKLEE